ncbi:hypothetical protein [Dactylosporangium sp. NPDC048998]|uniref:hypothetical protein n=1 Tax=Dactylosporangium sp. NPDC048998 TaxID=3363976 RepID=UPI00370FD8DE
MASCGIASGPSSAEVPSAASGRGAASATTSYLADHPHGRLTPQLAQLSAIHSYTTVFWWCAGIFVAGAVSCGGLLRRGPLARPGDIPVREPSQHATAAR